MSGLHSTETSIRADDDPHALPPDQLKRFVAAGFLELPPSPSAPPEVHATIAAKVLRCGLQQAGTHRTPYGLGMLDGDAAGNNLLHAAPELRGPALLESPQLHGALAPEQLSPASGTTVAIEPPSPKTQKQANRQGHRAQLHLLWRRLLQATLIAGYAYCRRAAQPTRRWLPHPPALPRPPATQGRTHDDVARRRVQG